MNFILRICSGVACKLYQENIKNYLKKSIVLCFIELLLALILKNYSTILFDYTYRIYATIYSINTCYILIKILNIVFGKLEKFSIADAEKKINLLKFYIKVILSLLIIKIFLEILYIGIDL